MIKAVISFILFNALAFLAFAFITWEINPAYWEAETRGLSIILGSMLGSLGILISGDL
jgi:hypothetical protein